MISVVETPAARALNRCSFSLYFFHVRVHERTRTNRKRTYITPPAIMARPGRKRSVPTREPMMDPTCELNIYLFVCFYFQKKKKKKKTQ